MSDITLSCTTAALPVQLRTDRCKAKPVPLDCLSRKAMNFKEGTQKQKSSYLSSSGTKRINSLFCSPVGKAKPPVIEYATEALLGADVSLETSSENPAAWKCCMRGFMRADGTTSHPRCTAPG